MLNHKDKTEQDCYIGKKTTTNEAINKLQMDRLMFMDGIKKQIVARLKNPTRETARYDLYLYYYHVWNGPVPEDIRRWLMNDYDKHIITPAIPTWPVYLEKVFRMAL